MLRESAPYLIALALALASVATVSGAAPPSGASMVKAARAFLNGLTPAQRQKAQHPFDTDDRKDWHFVPKQRTGLTFKEMNEKQRKLAHGLLQAGLSQKGYLKTTTIISLETVLRDLEGGRGPTRDPELYTFAVWGTPSEKEPWGWRVEGHHLSLNFTVVDGKMIATTPQFLGANPAEVKDGPLKGTRPLKVEEELARKLIQSMDEKQRKEAILDARAPSDIITGASRKADIGEAKGLPYPAMTKAQKAMLEELLEEYARAMPEELAKQRMEKLKKAGIEKVRFAWAGGLERGQGHYYRIQGPTFLVEYDNTQNNANHIHTVWRDFEGDWGEDLLRHHYEHGHHRPDSK
ncbi:MAG: DUF3500 domain-containing protein, partial [Armatimonadetes bacterium]|nr:DUF3500 domain-containing protein [Armatimonadota bacterium]